MRWFLGKGGAGKTTLAAAEALATARAGEPVLVVSIDRAHSLGDVLDLPPATNRDAGATDIRTVEDNLGMVEIDSLQLLRTRYAVLASMAALAGTHEHADQFDLPEPDELTGLPGVEELLVLAEVARLADSGRWALVVVDAPASADALRTLTAPRTVSDSLERIWPQHSRVAAATGPDPRTGVFVALFDRLLSGITAVRDLLDDRGRSAAVIVATPDRAGRAELARVRSWLALSGIRVDAVVVNGVVPAVGGSGAAARLLADQRAAHEAIVAEIGAAVTDVPVIVCERRAAEPVGLAALEELATALRRDALVPSSETDEPVRVQQESGTGVESVYAMRMYLPLADPASLTLGRIGDDLVVGADGMRRRVRLASGLRRCTVSDAEFDGTDLVVRFVPDPAVWPL
ncbi:MULTISPECIES: ArsA family ATPase [Rhodococcus]|uniref:ArsA-related P-loop ATPase n=2 Tax=Rhodococcus TaxID=1827 RepID=A0AAU7V1L8_9NOCA|nr:MULTISPECIES: ArsA-related P-loop ATPase [Rhodococcus]AWZ25563.1 arsenic-transporting ATPase [Rhodococcus pyridinivorans]EHK81351.1 putative transporter ATPase [Rhodococcus pyridinivorans AK37]KHJ72736.1 arsenic ABC transporter ATPase [Rhodococcus sp. Chr-9]MCD2116872.1 ArsA family ATPase [Rhodococcus pyridinivorans]MCD2139234.1 ArsA family ATPase [Rhodococcus pyridinivorans]